MAIVAIITFFTAAILFIEYYSEIYNDLDDQTANWDLSDDPANLDVSNQPANLEPAHFMDSMPPDYSISEVNEAEFNNLLTQNFEEGDLEDVNEMVAGLKENYPEGYFVILTQTLRRPEEFKDWYELLTPDPDAMETIIHEMTHTGGIYCGTFFIEDKCITIPDRWDLSERLFSGVELLDYIDSQNFIDEAYLEGCKHNIIGTLDEVNAYIKSVRTDRANKNYNSDPSTLARQMYYITLHLRHAKEEEPETWNILVDNKGFAYTLMRLIAMAEAELETAEEEGFSGINVTDNLNLYEENREYLDEFFVSAGVAELKDLDLTYIELQERGIIFGLEEM
ncbi:MAG: hypothetical protein U9Q67_02955 [Patescibacteria group bacterium]|nr:hypothetical protein [Patescibacteria group bacterium]